DTPSRAAHAPCAPCSSVSNGRLWGRSTAHHLLVAPREPVGAVFAALARGGRCPQDCHGGGRPGLAQALGTLVIVAMGQGANPRQAVPGDFSDLFGRLAPLPVARQFANGFAPLGLWPCGNVSRWLRCSNEL